MRAGEVAGVADVLGPHVRLLPGARAMTVEGALVAATGIVLGTLVALATLLPFGKAVGAPGLPAGSPLIYLTVIALAAALTIAVAGLSARLLRTAPGQE